MKTSELNEIINKTAPYELAAEWDNCGLLLDCGLEINSALFALDATNEALAEAERLGCGALVTHHPAIFGAVKALSAPDPVVTAAMKHISLFAAHTCWDSASGGVNDVLCERLGVEDKEFWPPFGRIGSLKSENPAALAEKVKKALGLKRISYVDCQNRIERVAVVGGAAGDLIAAAKWCGCDAFITGELKHHEALLAKQIGISAIAAGHFATEAISMRAFCESVQRESGGALKCLLFEDERDPLTCA
ncbi:MAG: Nif3-like dinuclear metal center hexameric protein [Oscillospiraceae bacterium]|nr:Nif3-like dinuclear metal center hexameric protein [Oscillospiraceae bacterium]